MNHWRRLGLGVLMGFAGLALANEPVVTPVPQQVEFNIPAQAVGDALNEFGRQSGLIVMMYSSLGKGTVSPAVVGRYTNKEALQKLLENTALSFEFVDARTVAVRAAQTKTITGDNIQGNDSGMRLAQLGQTDTGKDEQPPVSADNIELEEVLVTGTHIRAAGNSTASVTVLDRQYIESTGLATTAALIESLPQNFALANQAAIVPPGVSDTGQQGAGINLRGIGEGTTLVLLNGHRMALGFLGAAVDISALPLSAIDRVEVLTDGASAIYGSDAVGGVVNFILRNNFDGATTDLRAGQAKGGVDELQLSQALGKTWSSGNALLSFDYYKRDLLQASERDFVSAQSDIGSLFPRDENFSALFSGRQSLTEKVSVFADALYMKRNSFNLAGETVLAASNRTHNPQANINGGIDWTLARNWKIELSGGYAYNQTDVLHKDILDIPVGGTFSNSRFEIHDGRAQADGPVFSLPGGAVRVAVGTEWRDENFRFSVGNPAGPPAVPQEFSRTVRSAFAEARVPLFDEPNALTGLRRLELSLAGRYDDYSTFGSSFDPRFGLMWEPVAGLRARASYGTSFVAPKLTDQTTSGNAGLVFTGSLDPGLPAGLSDQFLIFGTAAESMQPQSSESWSFGLESTPVSMPGLELGLSYYQIDYDERIVMPPFSDVLLANPESYGSLFIRDPSPAQIDEFIAIGELGGFPFTAVDPAGTPIPNYDLDDIDVIVDMRRRNLSRLETSGFDAKARYAFDIAGAELTLGIDGTYILEIKQQVTSTSAPFETVDTVYNPPKFRARGAIGWARQGWNANVFINHTAPYTDNRTGTSRAVSSYTVVDGRVSYEFKQRFPTGFLAGVTVALDVQNLFDRDPPAIVAFEPFRDVGFDPTNANPMGRLVAVALRKAW